MFWADKLLEGRQGEELINDAWTPSGMVHMGGLKGPVIHDVLFKILKQQEKDVKFTFGFDDFDPIDGLPPELRKSHQQYLGVPIFMAPAPSGKGSFGDFFGNKMRNFFKELNIEAKIYLAHEYYKNGVYNNAIRHILDNADKVRKVYEEMYKKPILKDWFPFQVICPHCGKIGTTRVTAWDGEKVTFICEPDLVKWAKGCGKKGKISPFNGNGKMLWKVEWGAKWATFGVTIEGAGKDHVSAGGSYDVATRICEDVFGKKPPLKIPYEFFLYDGKKMSSSKGLGLNAEELLEVLPPEIVRFLMIKSPPNHAVEFNPNKTLIIPKLFDEYQEYAQSYFNNKEDDYARIFELSQVRTIKKPSQVRFSVLCQWVQMPNMQGEIKKEGLIEWSKYAKVWLERYAPESEKFMVQQTLPKAARKLSSMQKQYLQKISEELEKKPTADKLQVRLYDLTKENNLSAKEAFAAIYISLIGKPSGPKASHFLLSLDKEFIKKRFEEVSL